jgi:hypothetical protein
MAEKRLAKHDGKPSLKTLIINHRKDYVLDDPTIELVMVWDVVNECEDPMVEDLFGTKEAVTRLVQEAFGFDPGSPHYWKIRPAEIERKNSLNAEKLLEEFGIPKEPIYEKKAPKSTKEQGR